MSSESQNQTAPVSVKELQKMRLRVDYLNKQHSRYKKSLTGTYDNLLRVIENKMNHDESQAKKLKRLQHIEDEILKNHEKVRAMREKQQEELKKVKHSYFEMKRQESAAIKEMHRKYRVITLRRQQIEDNRKRQLADKIKETHQQTRIQNQQQLLSRKKSSVGKVKIQKANSKYPKSGFSQMTHLQNQARKLAIEMGCSQKYDYQIEELARQANKMSLNEFRQIAQQMRSTSRSKEEVKKKVAEQFLKKKNLDSLFKC